MLVHVGLGGNIGDVVPAMRHALATIDTDSDCKVVSVSPVYSTPPWGIVLQARFFNACAAIETRLMPHAFLARMLDAERERGRVRNLRWGPRTLDIDVLTYGDQTISTFDLSVPHPRMFERAFVMVPLADIAGDMEIEGQTIREWARRTDAAGIVRADEQIALTD